MQNKSKREAKTTATATMGQNLLIYHQNEMLVVIIFLPDFMHIYVCITPTDFIRIYSYVLEKWVWLKVCNHTTLKILVLQVQPEVQ